MLNRGDTVIGPIADTTVYKYDALFLSQVREAIGQTYQFSYNALGWIVTRTDPAGRQDRYQYDPNGNLRQATNRRGQVVSYGAYDALNRASSITADAKTNTFAYDVSDRFTAVSNNESTDTIKVDVAGRVQSQIASRAGTRYELVSHFNQRDLRDTLRSASPWADTIAYHYNPSMALDTLRDLAGGRTTIVYDQHLLDSAVVLPNGLTVTRQFPSTHMPAQITYSDGAVTAAIGAKYAYDTLGLVQDRHRVTSSNGVADSGRDYTYDILDRLTHYGDYRAGSVPTSCQQYDPNSAWCPSYVWAKTYARQESYSYDKVGNRTDLNAFIAAGDRVVKFNGDSLVYDADGNLVTRIRSGAPIQQLYWSSFGQLDSVWTSGVGTVSFGYDGLGRRVRKTVGSGTTRYIHDGDNLFAEVDAGAPTAPLAEYTYYGGLDQPHSLRRRMRSDSVFYYAQDFPRNVVGLVNGSKVLVNQYRYKPFGADDQGFPQGTVPNSFKFAGREFDTETGLYYMRARYYDPQLARFISEDPIGLAGGINLYTYVNNNPVNGTDPSGLDLCYSFQVAMADGNTQDFPCPDFWLDPITVWGTLDPFTTTCIPDAGQMCSFALPQAGSGFAWGIWGPQVPPEVQHQLAQQGPSCPSVAAGDEVTFVGFSATLAVVGGGTGGAGFYFTRDGEVGLYLRGGGAWGLDASVGVEVGKSSRAAFPGGSSGGCLAIWVFDYCSGSNAGGATRSGGVSGGLPIGATYQNTSTAPIKLLSGKRC